MRKLFQLWTTVIDWYDADTYHGILDQGMWTYRGRETKPVRHRCALIQAPELHDPGGPEALAYARQLVPPGEYSCWSYKPDPDSFGRPLVDLILPSGRLFSTEMLVAAHAVPYKAVPVQGGPEGG